MSPPLVNRLCGSILQVETNSDRVTDKARTISKNCEKIVQYTEANTSTLTQPS